MSKIFQKPRRSASVSGATAQSFDVPQRHSGTFSWLATRSSLCFSKDANQVFQWRKLLREGRLDVSPSAGQLLPVRIAEAVEDKPAHQNGIIQIELGR